MAIAQKVACRSAPVQRRGAVRVAASVDRRAVLGGVLSLVVAKQASAVTPVDLFNDISAKKSGFDYVYEARDDDLPESVRQGFTQARQNLEDTKARVKGAEKRIDTVLEPNIKKAYWTEAREQLRSAQFLRLDLNTLASLKPSKAEKKKALELRAAFIKKYEDLDLALRQKDGVAAQKKLDETKAALDAVLAYVL